MCKSNLIFFVARGFAHFEKSRYLQVIQTEDSRCIKFSGLSLLDTDEHCFFSWSWMELVWRFVLHTPIDGMLIFPSCATMDLTPCTKWRKQQCKLQWTHGVGLPWRVSLRLETIPLHFFLATSGNPRFIKIDVAKEGYDSPQSNLHYFALQ